MPKTYFFGMLRVWLLIISVMFAVVSVTASGHATAMAADMAHGAPIQAMEHAASSRMTTCLDGKACAPEAGLCDLVCAGIAVFLPPERLISSTVLPREKYRRQPDAIRVATAPSLNDRPPIAHHL